MGLAPLAPRRAPLSASNDGVCHGRYLRCMEYCTVAGKGAECSANCGTKCLACDFKRTGVTDAATSSCRR